MTRTGCPSDEERAFAAPYLTLMQEDAPQRSHHLREVFNGLRWLVRTGAQWRMMPNDFPPWPAVYQQAAQPSAVIVDGRTMQSTPESGGRAGYDGYKRKNGSKIHMAVDTLGSQKNLSRFAAPIKAIQGIVLLRRPKMQASN